MKSKITVITFITIAASLLAFLYIKLFILKDGYVPINPKTVIPSSDHKVLNNQAETNNSLNGNTQTFIPLLPTEILISTLIFDFDGDNYDDQIIAIRKTGSPNIALIVGIYNPENNLYGRSAEIITEISKLRTFSYNGIDVTGEHKNALVYQGINQDGDSVMKIYHCIRKEKNIDIINIGNFSSDGTIFIQQTERSESYELSQTKGESFSVWVYSSDKNDENTSYYAVNQIQTEYKWNEEVQKYIKYGQSKITGSRLAAKELARIQKGNAETFSQFLTGLWYKISNEGSISRYIYFDYESKEVIFLSEGAESIYSWEESKLRRSGIYITSINLIIPSMTRRFDIMLSSIDEILIHVHDNVGMIIKESNQWDGSYKKMSFQTTFGEEKRKPAADFYIKELKENNSWEDNNGNVYFFKDNTYKINLKNMQKTETGIFVIDNIGSQPVIQFKSFTESFFKSAYIMQFNLNKETKTSADNPIEKTTILLTPVQISPDACYIEEGEVISLTKSSQEP